MIRVVRHPYGPRLYLASYRVHHGTAGLAALGLSLTCGGRKRAALSYLAGAALRADWRDFPFTDRCNHNPRKVD